MTDPRAGGAVTDGKDVRVAGGSAALARPRAGCGGWSRVRPDWSKHRGLDAGRPHDEFCRNESSVGEPHATRGNLLDACRSMHLDAEILQDFQGLVGESFRQRWQDALSCLDQVNCN